MGTAASKRPLMMAPLLLIKLLQLQSSSSSRYYSTPSPSALVNVVAFQYPNRKSDRRLYNRNNYRPTQKLSSATNKEAARGGGDGGVNRENIRRKSSKGKGGSPKNTCESIRSNEITATYYIRFSRVFQRHVVYQSGTQANNNNNDDQEEVIQSFQYLDDAITCYPNARILAPRDVPFPPPLCTIDWTMLSSPETTVALGGYNKKEEECESTIAGMGLWSLCELEYDAKDTDPRSARLALVEGHQDHDIQSNDALRKLLQLVSTSSSSMVPRHFFRLDHRRFALGGHTPESITINHARVMSLLSCGRSVGNIGVEGNKDEVVGLAMSSSDVEFVLSNFPQLCLYDSNELEALVRFLLAPMPSSTMSSSVTLVADTGVGGEMVDWPRLAHLGYGAGLTIEQATRAIRVMPELMALYYEDSRKPSVGYMYTQTQQQLSPQLCDEIQRQLSPFLEGADFSDTIMIGYLYSLGISWKKLRVLLSAFPLWTTNNLDPGWEILQRGPVRSLLKRHSLDYLRQRLQVRPSDVYKMIKTHTRLSTYDAATKILPTLDKLQRSLDLRSSELKQLVLRMPSVIGMGTFEKDGGKPSALDQRLDFFQNEAGMSTKEIKESVLKQPSLIQYGIASSLRPKLDFFLHELGIPHKYIGRIIQTSPAVMGLSLEETLRPKVASIMKLCALHPYEVGMIVAISPQTLFLSQKGKIEPALAYLASALSLDEPRDLGELVLKAPRLLRQGLETSLMKKIDLIAESLPSNNEKDSKLLAAAEILRRNPTLFDASNAVITERIERCASAERDIAQYLLPSQKGRKKLFQLPTRAMEDPILLSSVETFDSISKIYSNAASAAEGMGVEMVDIVKACKNGLPLNGRYLSSLMLSRMTKTKTSSLVPTMMAMDKVKTVSLSLYCSGGSYPTDSIDAARGQSKTGGIAIQISSEGVEETRLLFDMSNAANKCFGIRVPIGRESSGNKLLAVFPLVNPSRNRCDLFACSSALRVLETFLATKRKDMQLFYDIKVYTDSTYAWKLVRDKERLMSLGLCFSPRQMLAMLDVADGSTFNIDMYHPLSRAFSRLNGQEEPAESTDHKPFYNSCVQFCHSFDGTLKPGEIKTLKNLAKSAAMWQFNRERSFVPK